MKSLLYKNLAIISVLILLTGMFAPSVLADEVVVSGNGDASTNQTVSNSDNQVVVTQSSTAQITNNVTTSNNTGSNTASNNTASPSTDPGSTPSSTTVQTGNSSSTTNIQNDVNNSTVNSNCPCTSSDPSNVTVSANGAASDNNTVLNQSSSTTVNINQDATVTNNITGSSNTGGNSANNDGGNVLIQTGNILAHNSILNTGINASQVSVPSSAGGSTSINISGNGAGSFNTVSITQGGGTTININNQANLINLINWLANTGNNNATSDNGSVVIKTGDILVDNIINNQGINVGGVVISCNCPSSTPVIPPPPPAIGGNPGSSNNSSGSSANSSNSSDGGEQGQVLGASVGQIMPVTGNNWMLAATLLLISTFSLGLYMRLSAKSAPAFVYDPKKYSYQI